MAARVVVIIGLLALGFGAWAYKENVEEKDKPKPPDTNPDKFVNKNVVGVEPGSDPVFNVDVELRMKGAQPNLHFTVTEQHGWYAEQVYIRFWWQEENADGDFVQKGGSIDTLCQKYLDFGGVLTHFTTPLSHEFKHVAEDDWPGRTENWGAEVSGFARILAPKE